MNIVGQPCVQLPCTLESAGRTWILRQLGMGARAGALAKGRTPLTRLQGEALQSVDLKAVSE